MLHSATRSDTSVPQTHQPIWIGRSPSRKSPGAATLLYVVPVGPSRSCSLLVVKNHHCDWSSQHRPRARAAESALYVIKQEIYIFIILSYIRIGCPGDIVYVSPDPRTFGPVMAFVTGLRALVREGRLKPSDYLLPHSSRDPSEPFLASRIPELFAD
jgi:hypothetical protein